MSSESIRNFVRENPYRSWNKVSDKIDKLLIATATEVDVFYGRCDNASYPPTQEIFVNDFLELCNSEFMAKEIDKREFAKRLARNWASFVMELDFYCQCRDDGVKDAVIGAYDTFSDSRGGRDILITYKGMKAYFSFYFATKKAKKYQLIKRERKSGQANTINFPLEPKDADIIGNMSFYTAEHVEKIIGILQKRRAEQIDATAWKQNFSAIEENNFDGWRQKHKLVDHQFPIVLPEELGESQK